MYDQPVALRTIMGWLYYADQFRMDRRNKVFINIDTDNEVFDIFFNCNNESIKNLKSKPPVAPMMADLSYQQNIFDWTFPYDIKIDF